jgi:chemotaxis protein CheZ
LIRDQVEAFVHRKVFRIEETMARPRAASGFRRAVPDVKPASSETKIVERELAAIFEAIDNSRHELAALSGHSSEGSRVSRSGQELRAAIGGMGQATEKILSIAEGIDEGARALTATLQDSYKRGVAQEIQDQVVQIFEACHFQDLAGQRINNAIATLKAVEAHVARLAELWGGLEQLRHHAGKSNGEARLLNGPKLDGDGGHANQADVDRLFG